MKNALLLHGTSASSKGNWFPWLKDALTEIGFNVWVPDLPEADNPNIERYNKFIFSSDWNFNAESIIVGHSSGSVAILGILESLPGDAAIDTAVFVGAFMNDLGRDDLKGLFEKPFDFSRIKTKARRFVFLHSDDDPFCPLPGAEFLATQLGGELIVIPGAKHFSIGTGGETYKELPVVIDLLHK